MRDDASARQTLASVRVISQAHRFHEYVWRADEMEAAADRNATTLTTAATEWVEPARVSARVREGVGRFATLA